jgi:predicted nucleic acid-binding Zn ribbon protein
MKARRDPAPLGSFLDSCLDRAAGSEGAGAVWRVWDETVGPQIARRAQPVRLRGRTLVVAVSSSPWMQELQMLRRSILEELHARLPAALIDDLHFVLTELGPAVAARPVVQRTRRCEPPPRTDALPDLPEALRRSFTDMLAAWRRRAAGSRPARPSLSRRPGK